MVFAMIVGWILTSFASYGPVFIIVGLLHPISFGIIIFMIPNISAKNMNSDAVTGTTR
jgi:hypothetical protein